MVSLKSIQAKIAWRASAPEILMVTNSFVWSIVTFTILGAIINSLSVPEIEKTILFFMCFLAVGVSAIFGAKFFPKARTCSLQAWFFVGAIATLLLTFITSNSMILNAVLVLFYGTSVGIGLPSCLSFFAESTNVEKRGFISGIIWSGVGFSVLFLAFLTTILTLWMTIFTLVIWRFCGGIGFIMLNRKKEEIAAKESPSYLEIFRKKEVLLYLLPWALFCFLNYAEGPVVESFFGQNYVFMQIMVWVIVGLVATIGGFIADVTGRKAVVISGFLMLGIEYATVSVLPNSEATMYFFSVLDGISWGLLSSIFLTTIWGDLGENYEKEKYYVVGGLTFFLPGFLSEIITHYVGSIPTTLAFSLASFFLFLAVLPLFYATETLPEVKIRERQLQGYLKKAEKVKEKSLLQNQ
jgi:MFS family permease